MELRTDPAALREKYQKVMDKFVYEGGEPEEKARLRHLLRNPWTSVTSMLRSRRTGTPGRKPAFKQGLARAVPGNQSAK